MFRKPERIISKVFLHCSDSDIDSHDNISVIRDWHVNGNGWSDVGYHYFITKEGEIQKGRDIEKVPAAQKDYNTGSIAICISGREKFNRLQMDTLVGFCTEIADSYNNQITFHGHCEVSDKTCPNFDYKNILNINEDGYLIKPIKEESSNLLTKTKNKMALPLLALAAPFIKTLAIAGFDKLKNAAKEKVAKKILDKTGIDLSGITDPKTAEDKINESLAKLSPEKLAEIKKEVILSETALMKAQIENETIQINTVNDTMRAEINSDDAWQKRWRPFNGFSFAITMAIILVTYAGAGIYGIYQLKPEIIKMISELVFATSPLIFCWSAVLGVSAFTRGKEKIEKLKNLNF